MPNTQLIPIIMMYIHIHVEYYIIRIINILKIYIKHLVLFKFLLLFQHRMGGGEGKRTKQEKDHCWSLGKQKDFNRKQLYNIINIY